jgi:hypothetical protein
MMMIFGFAGNKILNILTNPPEILDKFSSSLSAASAQDI